MKKNWFKRKTYGWGWTFGTWESYVVIAVYIAVNVYIFRLIDLSSHSGSDTLINFVPRFLLLTVALYLVCYVKGEKPRWQWGKKIEDVDDVLLRGGVAVLATDTTYGIVGSALNERTINEIYRLRKRDLDKPLIVLISDMCDLKKFGIALTPKQKKMLQMVWPGPVSAILPCPHDKFSYLHRGRETLAFRLPKKESLRRLIREVGPLVAPSANPQGHPVAKNIQEARAYFGHHVDFYKDSGTIASSPSKLIDITGDAEKILRSS